jgi:hypothetical protein
MKKPRIQMPNNNTFLQSTLAFDWLLIFKFTFYSRSMALDVSDALLFVNAFNPAALLI